MFEMQETPVPRAFCHAVKDSHSGLEHDIYKFLDQRVIPIAKKGDKVFLHPDSKGLLPTVRELTQVLNTMGFGPDPDDILCVDPEQGIPNSMYVLPFSGTSPSVWDWAKHVHGPTRRICEDANSKGTFQNIVAKLRHDGYLDYPDGEVVDERKDLLERTRLFLKRYPRAYVKAVMSGGSVDQTPISSDDDLQQKLASFIGRHVVIQQFIDVRQFFSVQFQVDHGIATAMIITKQLIEGDNHVGNCCPVSLNDLQQKEVFEITQRVASEIAKTGYFGPMSIDVFMDVDGKIWANEANCRYTAPMYAMGMFGDQPFHMCGCHIRPDVTVSELIESLGANLFNPETQCGVVPTTLLTPEIGFFYAFVTAKDVNELEGYVTALDVVTASLAREGVAVSAKFAQ